MDIEKIDTPFLEADFPPVNLPRVSAENFASTLALDLSTPVQNPSKTASGPAAYFSPHLAQLSRQEQVKTPAQHVVSAYTAQAKTTEASTGYQKYVDDQLLRNPGGDHYDLEEKKVSLDDPGSFAARVGKDLSDVFDNIKNFFSNMFMGAKFCYRDENNQIVEARHRGIAGSIIDFFKDLGSALTLGAWRPNGDAEPQGFAKRLSYAFSKLYQAFSGDLLGGIPGAINHIANDLALAGWNLAEIVPDATLGNISAGEQLTSRFFDTGQVVINYAADVIPSGEAWKRVHAFNLKEMKPPVLENLRKEERIPDDRRWRYVRNTPYRKAIETIGALIADVLSFGVIRWVSGSSGKDKTLEATRSIPD